MTEFIWSVTGIYFTMIIKKHRSAIGILTIALPLLLATACNTGPENSRKRYVDLEVWLHSGSESERRVLQEQVLRFNSSQQKIRVNAVILPAGTYRARIQAAARTGKLPDILEFNGPLAYPYIWRQELIPLDKLLTDNIRDDLLPSVLRQSMFQGRIYLLATHESTAVLYGRRSKLLKIGVRIPETRAEAWTSQEFSHLLGLLARQDNDGRVLDLKLNRQGEWQTFAFAPALWSANGALTHPRNFPYASGLINGPASIAAMRVLQSWARQSYVDSNKDDNAFASGRVSLSWADQSEYSRYRQAVGDDLVILPLPDFGNGSRSGQGGWAWSVSSNCRNSRAAMHFLEFLFRPDEVLKMANASETVPATRSAIERSPRYRKGGPLNLFVQQLETSTVFRPQSAAYPEISAAFQRAFKEILHGGDVKKALDKAALVIDQAIKDKQDDTSPKRVKDAASM